MVQYTNSKVLSLCGVLLVSACGESGVGQLPDGVPSVTEDSAPPVAPVSTQGAADMPSVGGPTATTPATGTPTTGGDDEDRGSLVTTDPVNDPAGMDGTEPPATGTPATPTTGGDDEDPGGPVTTGPVNDPDGTDSTEPPATGTPTAPTTGGDDNDPDGPVMTGPVDDPDGTDSTEPPATDDPDFGESTCLDGITDFGGDGPFQSSSSSVGRVNLWVPDVPKGCKVPVIHLANGTGARCSTYRSILEAFASHGFLSCCYEDTNTGAGTQGVEALTTAIEQYPDLAAQRIGSTGHSQGGQAAFTVLQQAEQKWGDSYIYAGLAIQPASGFGDQPPNGSWQDVYSMIRSPMFMFSGTSDTLVSASWVGQAFDALDDSIEAYNWSAARATHIPTPNSETIQVGIPWFRWKLLGDQAACRAFKALPEGGTWSSVEEQNPRACE